ncbi:MAG: arylsulfatase [Bacteroidales bacterium]|nr:arylsulfatase [Bacteroidales bacterium]
MKHLKGTGLALLGTMAAGAVQAQEKPNIILILLDDVGYSDIGCYGSEIETPNIDRLAENGIRMRHFYNSARSAPTRVSLMTGLYPHQAGQGALGKVEGYPAYQGYANENNVFIPEVLHQAGYFNIMTGKWHIGYDHGVTPISRGFDRSLNAPVGGYYFSTDMEKEQKKQGKGKKRLFRNDIQIAFDDPSLPERWYSSDLWTQAGLEYVDEAIGKGQPFFWYLAYNGAHFPLQAPEETIAKYRGKYMEGWEKIREERYEKQLKLGLFSESDALTPRNPKIKDWDSLSQEEKEQQDHIMSIYAAVIEEIDKGIGLVVSHLEEKGELDNTLIIFLSDNGGNAEGGLYGKCFGKKPGDCGSNVWLGTAWADVSNTPFFLYKHHGHEGGCNTPLIISWPDGIDQKFNGSINMTEYGHVTDIMATLVDLSGADYPSERAGNHVQPMEGISLLPILRGKDIRREKPLIVEHEGNKMLRDGDWKIVQEYGETDWMLYNLKKDPTEMNDLAARHPALLRKMVAKYHSEAERTGVEPEIRFKTGVWYTPVQEYRK